MGLLDDLVGGVADLLGLGGGGGGSSVTYGVVSTIQGGDKAVGLVSTIQGGDKAVVVDVGLDDVNIDSGLDNINIDVGGTGTAVKTSSEYRVLDKIRSETDVDLDLDVRPVQVDLCVNVGLTKLPKATIRQPYESHFGVSMLGAELMGFDWRGESNVIIDELRSRPHVEPGRVEHEPVRRLPRPQRRAAKPGGDGLHIRVG